MKSVKKDMKDRFVVEQPVEQPRQTDEEQPPQGLRNIAACVVAVGGSIGFVSAIRACRYDLAALSALVTLFTLCLMHKSEPPRWIL